MPELFRGSLIKTARGLTKLSPRRPTQANLRRAVSTADYALEGSRYYKSDVIVEVDAAERAIDQFERAAVAARRGFDVHVLFRQRPSQEVPR